MILALAIGGASLVASLLLKWPLVVAPAAVATAAAAAFCREQVRRLFNKWLLLALGLSIFVPVWIFGLSGEQADRDAGAPAFPALAVGLALAVRIMTTLAAMILFGSCISPLWLHKVVKPLLGKNVATACAIAVNLLPSVLEILSRTTLALRLRGGFRRRRLANFKRLAIAVGVQTVRLTDDVAEALLLSDAVAARTHDVAVADGKPSSRENDDLSKAC